MNKLATLLILLVLVMPEILIVQEVRGEEVLDQVDYWALIICGDDFPGQSYSRDAGYMYHVLTEHCLFNDATIYYLHVDTTVPGVDALATKENVRSAITSVLTNWSDQNDIIFIFFTDHGGGYNSITHEMAGGRVDTDGDEGNEIWNVTENQWIGIDECLYLCGTGQYEKYFDDELAEDLDYLASQNKYGQLIFVTLACYSGGLVDDISAPNRTIMTSANETFTGLCDFYGEYGGPGYSDLYSEWSEVFLDALHGEDTYWDIQKNLVIHKGIAVDADYDDDGKVSMKETWDYAWEHDDGRLHGNNTDWLDDNGNGYPTYINGSDAYSPWDPNDGFLADSIWLPKAWVIDLNRDGIIDIFDVVRVALAFGSEPASSNWDALADVNDDYITDIFDLASIAINFGETLSSSSSSSSKRCLIEEDLDVAETISISPRDIGVRKHDIFSVNVTLENAADVYGWEFKVYWNSTVLNLTSAQIYAPELWGQDFFAAGVSIQNDFNETYGRYWKAMSALNPSPSFNGNMTLASFTFEALNVGIAQLDLQDVKLADAEALSIDHSDFDGTVTVMPPPLFMRSDQHTVNGVTMNKLLDMHTQYANSTSISATDTENELVGYWGIRIWKRSCEGTETELTLGSPVAVVSRSSSGQGLQSANWSCPATNLSTTDSLVARVYYKFSSQSSYTLCCQFTTVQLNATWLNGQTWTVQYYTSRSFNTQTHRTTIYFYWDNTYNSKIENVNYN